MHILGVIPARGGSKGIPGKNLALLDGRPLIAHTCEAATASRMLTHVVVSTDSAAIAAVAREQGIDVPFLRPAHLAADDTPMIDVLTHLVASLGERVDVVVLLQPTSPLRGAAHIDEATTLLVNSGADSVVSVTTVPHQYTPGSLMRMEAGRLVPLEPGPMATRRQDKPVLYARNGPAVLATRGAVVQGGRLYGDDTRAYVMAPEDSIDIDGPIDLVIAEALLAARRRAAGVAAS